MNRRNFLVAAPLFLAACQTTTPFDQTLAKVVSDVNILATGLKGVLTQLTTTNVLGLTSTVLNTITTAISNIQAIAGAIGQVTSIAATQPLIQKIESYVNTVVAALAALPLPPAIAMALQAASILLPIIETAVGLLVTAKPMLGSTMNGDEARIILRGMAR